MPSTKAEDATLLRKKCDPRYVLIRTVLTAVALMACTKSTKSTLSKTRA